MIEHDSNPTAARLVNLIASEVGVSERTVRRCLSGIEAKYGSARRRMGEIRAAADRLGYRPNPAARALRRGSFSNALLVSSLSQHQTYLPKELFAALEDRLTARALHLSYARIAGERLNDPVQLQHLLSDRGADGLLLDYIDHLPNDFLQPALARLGVPAVWINRELAHDAVVFADEDAMAGAAAALAMRGRRRIAYIDLSHAPDDQGAHYSARHRLRGWLKSRLAMGATDPSFVGKVEPEVRLATLRAWFAGMAAPPDAICAYSADQAAMALHAAHLAGLTGLSPGDVAAVDDAPTVLGAPYVCARLSFTELGKAAVDLLLRKVEDPASRLPTVVIPTTLIVPPG